MPQLTIQQAFDLALRHHQAGQLPEAEQLYRQILAHQPANAEAIHCLGVIAFRAGRHNVAADLIRQAIALNPGLADAHSNLGNVLAAQGQLDEAIASHRQAITLRPDLPAAHYNLGNALKDKGRLDEAIAAWSAALSRQPDYFEARCNVGNALMSKGELDAAIAAYGKAIALRPSDAETHANLGNALHAHGRLHEAIAAYRQAIAIRPDYAEAHRTLGFILKETGQLDEAIAAYRQAIAIRPKYAEAHSNLGNALTDKGQLDEAIEAFRQAIALKPDLTEAHNNLGNALMDRGQIDEGVAACRQAVALQPDFPELHSNLLFNLHFHPGLDALAIAHEARRWNRQHAESLRQAHGEPPRNDRTIDRPLRIGYVSPDFWNHIVGRNLLPLLSHHDRQQFNVTCYAHVLRPDAMTSAIQQHADGWRSIVGLTDQQAAEQIREDRIDILIDLALHTVNNRLLVFARKPSPVQVTFAGYPGSTGLSTIDYRLSDPYLDPPGMDESIYSERTIRLPDSFWCYDPLDCGDIPVNPLPALSFSKGSALSAPSAVEGSASSGPPAEGGVITFGCLNNFCKVNDGVLALWAAVLRQVKGSRLLLRAQPGSHRQRTADRLSQDGIDPERIEFVGHLPRRKYLQMYHRLDIGLDSFPYNGHATSLDSFWMGVPVVTLVGQRVVSRAGWCQLSNLGLTELAGHTPEQFVQIAVELAKDLPRLAALRATLRQRMEQSPLMDAPKFARNVEAAYRQMWRTWCESGCDGAAKTPSK
jgi:predicted O-linked N-acetylglucosamine transferase (SPINDLY family)